MSGKVGIIGGGGCAAHTSLVGRIMAVCLYIFAAPHFHFPCLGRQPDCKLSLVAWRTMVIPF